MPRIAFDDAQIVGGSGEGEDVFEDGIVDRASGLMFDPADRVFEAQGNVSLAGAAVLVVAFICFTLGWIGGGDAKLAAVTVLWLGLGHLADYLVYASLLGGALTIALIQFRTMPMPQLLKGRQWAERLHRQDTGVPYGIALAVAALVVYPQTEWMTALTS